MSVGIIFICYALHTKYKPFLPPNNDMLDNEAALTSGMALVYVSVCTNALQCVHQCAPVNCTRIMPPYPALAFPSPLRGPNKIVIKLLLNAEISSKTIADMEHRLEH
jgi:hypothetical protein